MVGGRAKTGELRVDVGGVGVVEVVEDGQRLLPGFAGGQEGAAQLGVTLTDEHFIFAGSPDGAVPCSRATDNRGVRSGGHRVSIIAIACRGLVANPTSSGTSAARHRSRSGVVHDQHTVPVTPMFHHVTHTVITHTVDIPVRPPQQPLHLVRRHLAGPLSQRLPVPALQPRGQPEHVHPHPSPRLRPHKPVTDPSMHPVQLRHGGIVHHDT